jgi:hypothetical protein
MPYIVLADLKRELNIIEADHDALMQDKIDAAEHYITQMTRQFEAVTNTRYYDDSAIDPEDSSILHLDEDLVTCTELLNADSANTEIVAADYWLLDRNLGPPYRAIKLDSSVYWQFDLDEWVSVTGTWGYSANTDEMHDVREATIKLAAYLYRSKDSQVFNTVAIQDHGTLTIPQGIPQTVRALISKYRKRII